METVISRVENAIGRACTGGCISCEELFATVEEAVMYLHVMADKEKALRDALKAIKGRLAAMARMARDKNCLEDYRAFSRAVRELRRLIAELVP